MKITKEILIEELVNKVPESVEYLAEKGIRCIRCGEPIWGSLDEAAKEKAYSDSDIEGFVIELNNLIST
jgi:methionine synthase II (cobalamin-independent)